ncbi:7-carboxy-7-deazaguanine synthase QueE [Faecalibacter rhinopitheci]|uniref:7-carboxy-7-deazaguanine synthase n=1 Tax=Faecalibacter rhinopitheci TaxID=2779678 RepID=A0A8J7KHY0_9FLAO|nr:7-carboxy-7-deazaguanine synthase QueE [Faecalibacter rhinopitheci]MBF0596826.1 7-carboxy-7-deazaguanine synthase QueE [Faecalibacter rhinopitheci]MBQ0148237.1 7-carboxy-7-deazaguanine synthase QueE [Candidatus Onthonaster equi]
MINITSTTTEQQQLLKEGKLLPIMEHFYTIQGEGAYTGVATYFIRLGGCDVGCHWCDVKDSWDAEKHPLTLADDIAEIATAQASIIVITGGEPLMWDLTYLTKVLHEKGARIHIETSGAYSMSGEIDWVCLSPKKTMLPKDDVYKAAHELKCIIFNQHDFKFAEEQAARVGKDCVLYLQTEWSKREKNLPEIVEYVKENPKWRISLQTHKYLDIP